MANQIIATERSEAKKFNTSTLNELIGYNGFAAFDNTFILLKVLLSVTMREKFQ